jgi:hypothetical protein
MRVRALYRGYYGGLVRRPGDVFTLAKPEDFSALWMVVGPADTPESRTTAQQALQIDHDSRSPIGATRRVDTDVDPDDDGKVDIEFDPFT